MIRSVFIKTLYDKRGFMIGWFIAMLLLAMLLASFFPAMRADGSLDALVASMPPAFEGLIGDLADLKTFDRYIASQLYDIRVPIIAGIMAIILGLGISTREEEDGELRTMLSLPISRGSLLLQKWLAMLVIMAVVGAGLVLGVHVVMPFIDDAALDWSLSWQLAAVTWLVMCTFGTVTFAIGMATGRRSWAMTIGTTAIIGSFLLSTFAAAVDWLEPYEPWSLLHYFPAVDIAKGDFDWANILVLTSVTLISLLVAWLAFRRRDIN